MMDWKRWIWTHKKNYGRNVSLIAFIYSPQQAEANPKVFIPYSTFFFQFCNFFLMKKLLITWANWMLAHDLIASTKDTYELVLSDIKEMDITSRESISSFFEHHKPNFVVNCAAYTAVDKAEDEWQLLNYKVNVLGQWLLAKKCAECWIPWITISTDYVFNGENNEGYLPCDSPDPVNQYGMAKYLGEQVAFQHNPETIILRTSRLYGGGSDFKNFVNTMIRLWTEKESLKVVDDQVWIPTYAVDLAAYVSYILEDTWSYAWKILHANNAWTPVSRYWFAKEIFDQSWIEVACSPCSSDEYPLPAKRPSYSMMLSDDTQYQFPDRKDWLRRYVKSI